MLSQQILTTIASLRAGGNSAPVLVSEGHACEIVSQVFELDILDLDELAERGVMDFLYYDCADRENDSHKADTVRKHVEKLYQKPSEDIFVALFRNIDSLTETSANALLRIFEDVPSQVMIIVTSRSPARIISTLQSRMLMIDGAVASMEENPHIAAVEAYVSGDPQPLFSLTLHKDRKFTRDDALWIIRGLQDAITYGTLNPRHARRIGETQIALETTNTIAKYLIDQLLISLACE